MQIPNQFKNKVVSVFGEKGRDWLEELPRRLKACIEKWRLVNCRLSKNLSMNLIVFAESPEFGPVALKAGVPHPDLFTEMKALSLYNGRHICKCYDFDVELGALLLERVMPGEDLRVLQSSSERIREAVRLISRLPIPVMPEHGLPEYEDWLRRAFTRARRENKVGTQMLSLIDAAEVLFKEIDTADRPKVLLHGDLHHENMLRDSKGQWKAIDPKGIIGVPCMEAARFMENQFGMVCPEERLACLDEMITAFSTEFREPKRIVAACLFVLKVLSVCWSFEDYEVPGDIDEGIKECSIYLDYVEWCL